ncbi:MAG TPA: three-Cys-motif partner protein TcmP [Verrucomicrobiae bacterium]|nr:three-Cys-motif partner protein TcmP [Verrucomicrobiae bacterium]
MKPSIYYLPSADNSAWKDGISKIDCLPIRESGVWIEKKHKPLVYYSEIFNAAMKDKPWDERIYFELFAGPGCCFVRETKKEESGSPLQVLETNFTKFIFVEMSKAAAEALVTRIDNHKNASKVEIWCGDCAEAIKKIIIPPKSLTFAFIDPTRIGHAPFKLISVLATKARSDILINIPIGTDIKRNLHNYLAQANSEAPLTKYLGSDEWKTLPTNSPSNFCRGFLELYEAQLRKLGYKFIGKIQQVTTLGNVPLYYLFFASKHQLGEKFWNDTLKRVNEPELFE